MKELSRPSTDRSLLRTIAGASRKLSEDLNLSPLQAIDRLQKLDAQFREHWYFHPWLVLEDCFTLPAHMPVARMLEEFEAHGGPIGIVGAARITAQQDSVFKMMFRSDSKSQKTVEASAQAAKGLIDKANEVAAQTAKEIIEKELRKQGGPK